MLNFSIDKNRLFLILLFVVFVFFLLINCLELSVNDYEQWADDRYHLAYLYEKYTVLKEQGLFSFITIPCGFYPPLACWVGALFMKVAGPSLFTAVLSQSIFWFILIFSMYFLGRQAYNEFTGFLSALIILGQPVMNIYSTTFHLDIPQTALTALSAYLLLKTDLFRNRAYTLLFFTAGALGMLSKVQFAFCFAGFFFYYLIVFLMNLHLDKRERIVNTVFTLLSPAFIILSLVLMQKAVLGNGPAPLDNTAGILISFCISMVPIALFLTVSLWWPVICMEVRSIILGIFVLTAILQSFYGLHLNEAVRFARDLEYGAMNTDNLPDYIHVLSCSVGMVTFVLFIAGTLFHIFCKEKDLQKNTVLVGALVGILTMYWVPVKVDRFFYPLSVFMAPVAIYWITVQKLKILRIGGMALVSCLSLAGISMGLMRNIPLLEKPCRLLNPVSGHFRDNTIKPGFYTRDILRMVNTMKRGDNTHVVWIYPEKYHTSWGINSLCHFFSLEGGKWYRSVSRLNRGGDRLEKEFEDMTGYGLREKRCIYEVHYPFGSEKVFIDERDIFDGKTGIIYVITLPRGEIEKICGNIERKNSEGGGKRYILVRAGRIRGGLMTLSYEENQHGRMLTMTRDEKEMHVGENLHTIVIGIINKNQSKSFR